MAQSLPTLGPRTLKKTRTPPSSGVTESGHADTSPTKHLPVHLRRVQLPSSATAVSSITPPSTPSRELSAAGISRHHRPDTCGDHSGDEGEDPYDEDPVTGLLLHLGISLPPHPSDTPPAKRTPLVFRPSSYPTTEEAKPSEVHLTTQLLALRTKIIKQESSINKSLHSAIHSSISEAAAVVGIIGEELWVDRQFGISSSARLMGVWGELFPPGLVSEENIGRKITDIECEVERLSVTVGKTAKGMEEVKYTEGAGIGHGAVQTREMFVARWGRGGI